MPGDPTGQIIIPGDTVRDFMNTQAGLAAGYAFDVPSTGSAIGLDVFIHNRGAAALTIAFNGQGAITVNAGAVYTISNTKIWLVIVVSAVLYDLQITGIRLSTLKLMGLM